MASSEILNLIAKIKPKWKDTALHYQTHYTLNSHTHKHAQHIQTYDTQIYRYKYL